MPFARSNRRRVQSDTVLSRSQIDKIAFKGSFVGIRGGSLIKSGSE